MSFFKRLGNVVKASVSLAGSDAPAGLSQAALEAELARITPGSEARDRLAALKQAAAQGPPASAAPAGATTDDQAAKLQALARRFEAGELERRDYDRLRAEVLHGPGGTPERTL